MCLLYVRLSHVYHIFITCLSYDVILSSGIDKKANDKSLPSEALGGIANPLVM